ncbi:TonB family protein [Nitrospira sp. Nam80]
MSLDVEILPDRMSGWLISLVTHAVVASMAILLMNDLHLAKQPEPFQWEVSVTQSSVPQGSEVPSPPTPIPPPTHNVTQTRTPAQKVPVPASTPIERVRHATHAVQSVAPVTHRENRHVEPVTHSRRLPVEPTQPQPAVTQETSPIAQVETRSIATKTAAASTTEIAVTESEHSVVQSPPMVEQKVVERTDPIATGPVAALERTVTEASEVINPVPSRVEVSTLETKPGVEPSLSQHAIESVPVETSLVETMAVTESTPVEPMPPAPIQQASIQNLPIQSMPAAKADYDWLLDTLWRRVEKLKRYPHIARANRWEGLVILQAVIDGNGQLLDLKVAESSGYAVLDQDAMDVLKRSCPLHLKHSLGKPQVELRIPINYKLR